MKIINLTLYHPLSNIGDAFAIDNSQNLNKSEYFIEDIELSELNVYLPYFENKHLALLKLDVEGSEEKVIKSGIDLIVKYHIPFILMELNIKYLTLKGTNPKIFLEMFENNGYKISAIDFLSKKYSTIEKILKKVKDIINLYTLNFFIFYILQILFIEFIPIFKAYSIIIFRKPN